MIIFRDVNHLQGLLESASKAHHEAEKRLPKHDWARWYGAYLWARIDPTLVIFNADKFADEFVTAPSDPRSGSAF